MIYTGLVKFIIIRSYITIKESTRGDLDELIKVIIIVESVYEKKKYIRSNNYI